ncbi:phospholipase D-like domain-containing protein [Corallococcus terminator]|uniref:PLD phosphodiesterase domain-containing protein n=1 Tax=Corallococcus terminator TaxID=2316733 RepID=A0A3A8I112_9BACT|nr:phospholipase D-like domain-containing protein [Corallococcus terminator]RKG71881.1 hypothetical protein D7V88_39010 [Corallococcus terminator]
MAPFQVQLTTTSKERGIEFYDEASWIDALRGTLELEVVSCFFGIDWLNAVRERLAASASLILHLNRPPSGSKQLYELEKFLIRAKRRGPTEVYLHTGPRGLFHSKLYVLRKKDGTTTYVGSSNATGSAFRSNEEILLEVVGARSPAGVDAYLRSLQTKGQLLQSGAYRLTLEHFFREARLVFRPTRADPFRLPLPPVREAPEASERARGLVYSGTGAMFSLWASVELDDASGDVEDSQSTLSVTAAVRPRAIETTYGFWIPIPYFEELSPTLDRATQSRIKRLDMLRSRLAKREDRVREQFRQALRDVQSRGQKPLTEEDVKRKLNAFDNLLEVSCKRLEDPEWVRAHAKRYYDAIVPDLFTDPETRTAFLASFTYDLSLRLEEPGQRRSRIVKALLNGIKNWAEPSLMSRKGAFLKEAWFLEALESMLQADDFTIDALWGVVDSEEDD